MERGKKNLAQRIFYDAMDIVGTKVTDSDVLTVFEEAMEKVRPKVEVKSRRVGGATYQVPMEVRQTRRNALAIRWIISFAKARSGNCWMPIITVEQPLKNGMIPTGWQKRIRPLPIIAGKEKSQRLTE
jgi:ribosomal protein S7